MNIESLEGDRGKRIEIEGYEYVAVVIPDGYLSISRLKEKSMKEIFALPLKTEWPQVFNITEIYHRGYVAGFEAGERRVIADLHKLLRLPGP